MNKNTIIVGAVALLAGAGAISLVPQTQGAIYEKVGEGKINISESVSQVIDINEVKDQRELVLDRCNSQLAEYDKILLEAAKVGVEPVPKEEK